MAEISEEAVSMVAAAIREGLRIRLEPNALAMAQAGAPVMLSGGEADEAARLALAAAAPLTTKQARPTMTPGQVPESWVLDAVDAWHECPRNEQGLVALDEEMAFILAKVAPSIAEQARAEGRTEERARIVASLRSNADRFRRMSTDQKTLGADWSCHAKAFVVEEVADAIEASAEAETRDDQPVSTEDITALQEAIEAGRVDIDELAALREEVAEDVRVMQALRRHRDTAEAGIAHLERRVTYLERRAESAEARLGIAEEDLARSKDAHGRDVVRAVRAEAGLAQAQALADEWDALPHEVWQTAARALRERLAQPAGRGAGQEG